MISFGPVAPPQKFLTPSVQFIEDLAIVSRSRSWIKWKKAISKKMYQRIIETAQMAHDDCILTQEYFDAFQKALDHYLENGCLDPDLYLYHFQYGFFSMLRAQIDQSLHRRARAVSAAERRREQKERETAEAASPDDCNVNEAEDVVNRPATDGEVRKDFSNNPFAIPDEGCLPPSDLQDLNRHIGHHLLYTPSRRPTVRDWDNGETP